MPFFVDESVRLAGIVSFMCALALAFLALRLWGRGLRRVGLFPSDYLAAVAMIFTLLHAGCLFAVVAFLMGPTLRPLSIAEAIVLSVIPLLYTCSFSKLSMIQTFREIVPFRTFSLICSALMFIVIAFCLAATVVLLTSCRPFPLLWDKSFPGECINVGSAMISFSAINTGLDLVIIFLPLPVVWNLQMAPRKKLLVSCLFSFGVIVIIISSFRLYYTIVNETQTAVAVKDRLFALAYFTLLEATMSIICACLPGVGPAVEHLYGKVGSTMSRPRRTDDDDAEGQRFFAKGHASVVARPVPDELPLQPLSR